jgi:hypothetical protein
MDNGQRVSKSIIEQGLEKYLFKNAKNVHRKDYFCLQQAFAPFHKAKLTRKWLKDNLPVYFSPKD